MYTRRLIVANKFHPMSAVRDEVTQSTYLFDDISTRSVLVLVYHLHVRLI
jgi:hypothetical protein